MKKTETQTIKLSPLEKQLLKDKASELDIDVSKLLLWSALYPDRLADILKYKTI
jgi:hypothetical protein